MFICILVVKCLNNSFVLHFIDLNGLEYLQEFLRGMNYSIRYDIDIALIVNNVLLFVWDLYRQSQLHYNIIGCIKAVMNNAVSVYMCVHVYTLKCIVCVSMYSIMYCLFRMDGHMYWHIPRV